MPLNQKSRGDKVRTWLPFLGQALGVSVVLLVLGWAGAASLTVGSLQATKAVGDPLPAYSPGRSALATTTPMVILTPTTVPPFLEEFTTYLPLIQKQVVIPGSLSIAEVYTANYDGSRQTTFQPCQALALWVRMRNDADIPQTAILFWQTREPEGRLHANLGDRRQVNVPPGESAWHFFGAPDLDAPAGTYQFQVWFTSGTDRQALEGAFLVAGQPVPTRYLEGMTAKIDPEDYEFVLSRVIVPWQEYATYPMRTTDVFTAQDKYVVQSTVWEGVRRDSVILTRRYRPDGRPFGLANYAFLGYDLRPGCLRRQSLYWEIDEWMKQTPGQWRFELSTDGGQTWQGRLFFTLID